MPVVVRPVQQADLPAVAELLAEMDVFYGQAGRETAGTKVANMRAHVFGPSPSGHLLIAVGGGSPVGIAAYSFLWPAAGTSRGLFLKDLYVASSRRRDGVGRLLMDALIAVAREAGCSRIDWTTDLENTAAQRLYDSLGATRLDTKLFYRLPL